MVLILCMDVFNKLLRLFPEQKTTDFISAKALRKASRFDCLS